MRRRRHTKAFKLAALSRLDGASDVRALAAELGVDRGLLYKWNRAFQSFGEAGLRLPGERGDAACIEATSGIASGAIGSGGSPIAGAAGVAALERKVAQQALELDFFRAALQHFAEYRRRGGGTGGTGSTP